MKEYIEREAALKEQVPHYSANGVEIIEGKAIPVEYIENLPAADVVPWEWLERYADYFCVEVSMPEFVREAKMFYESSNKAMQGGVIDG